MVTKYRVRYLSRCFIDKHKLRDYDQEVWVEGIIYETESIVCYKINKFENITLCKGKNLMTGEMYLYR